MTAFRCSNEFAITALNAGLDLFDTAGPGEIKIYTGSIPATCETAASGTLLGTLTFSATAFGAATDDNPGATASAAAITDDSSADATGTAGYFRALESDGTVHLQGDCGTSAADMIMNTTSVTAGLAISITSYVVVLPET
jgi:hypothetical protein